MIEMIRLMPGELPLATLNKGSLYKNVINQNGAVVIDYNLSGYLHAKEFEVAEEALIEMEDLTQDLLNDWAASKIEKILFKADIKLESKTKIFIRLSPYGIYLAHGRTLLCMVLGIISDEK